MIDIIKNFTREHPAIAKEMIQLIYAPLLLIFLLNKLKNRNEDMKERDIFWLKASIVVLVLIILYIVFSLITFFFI